MNKNIYVKFLFLHYNKQRKKKQSETRKARRIPPGFIFHVNKAYSALSLKKASPGVAACPMVWNS